MTFVNSMSDLFHEVLPSEAISAVFGVMAAASWHTFQILTKRPERMAEWLNTPGIAETCIETFELATRGQWPGWPLPNVWLGTSIEAQEYAEQRLPALASSPAALRFASAEPLLGPLNLESAALGWGSLPWLDWLITGGESGPGARPLELEWLEALIQQAARAGRPIFVKQLGKAWAGKGKGGDPSTWPENLRRRELPQETNDG